MESFIENIPEIILSILVYLNMRDIRKIYKHLKQ